MEWTARKIIADLKKVGYIEHQKRRRNNVYQVDYNIGLRHISTQNVILGNLLRVLALQEEGE